MHCQHKNLHGGLLGDLLIATQLLRQLKSWDIIFCFNSSLNIQRQLVLVLNTIHMIEDYSKGTTAEVINLQLRT